MTTMRDDGRWGGRTCSRLMRSPLAEEHAIVFSVRTPDAYAREGVTLP
jgi:hypothetical protein